MRRAVRLRRKCQPSDPRKGLIGDPASLWHAVRTENRALQTDLSVNSGTGVAVVRMSTLFGATVTGRIPGRILALIVAEPRIPVGFDQSLMLPVLVMTLTYSKTLSAVMIPSRQAGDILAGMWQLISGIGKVSKTLLWDRESAIGGTGRASAPAASFAGTLATKFQLAPPRDPEFEGMAERNNGFLETSFLPGRDFASRRTSTSCWPTGCRKRARARCVP